MNRMSTNQNLNNKPENLYAVTHMGAVDSFIHSQAFLFGEFNMSRFRRKKKVLGVCKWCNGEAIHKFKNGNLCCNNHQNKCPIIKKILSEKKILLKENHWMKNPINAKKHGDKLRGTKHSEERRQNHPMKNPKNAKAHSEKMKGRKHTKKSKEKMSKVQKGHYVSEETKRKISDKHRGKIISEETRAKISKTLKGRIFSKEWCEKISKALTGFKRPKGRKCPMQSEYMKNGGAAHCNSFIKNPSKPQVELFNLIKSIYSTAILNYPSLNFSIDIAIPDKNIAIEYDGSYWHNEEKDVKRQKLLENIGWKFLRYLDYVPKIDELKTNLKRIM